MKKKFPSSFMLGFVGSASAKATINYDNLPDWSKDPSRVVINIINALLFLLVLVAVTFLIVGGYRYITATGNPEQIEKAKHTILYAIIGLIVVLLAYAITRFVLGIFNIKI